MRRRGRLAKEDKEALAVLAPRLNELSVQAQNDTRNARRALIAGLLLRNYSLGQIQVHLVRPVDAGGLGVFVSEGTIKADIEYVQQAWQDQARAFGKHALASELARLSMFEGVLQERVEHGDMDAMRLALSIIDRRVHLMGTDAKTQAALHGTGDMGIAARTVADTLAQAREIRRRNEQDGVVDIEAE